MIKHIPNIITLGNAFFGCIAAVKIFEATSINDLVPIIYFLIIAAALDFADGLAARALKAYSNIGKDLDSLADGLSFGFVPGAIVYKIMLFSLPTEYSFLAFSGFIITLFSILRLAIFNNDTRQTDSFIGVPTPINALVWASIPYILIEYNWIMEINNNYPWIIIIDVLIMSLLLVSELKLLALKFKNFSFSENKTRYLLIVISILLISILKLAALPFILITYILLSLIFKSNK